MKQESGNLVVANGKNNCRLTLCGKIEETEKQAQLLQDFVGVVSGPFAWRSPAVLGLAAIIYGQGSFDLMPALGAARSDAG